ncbi:MAG: DUF6291 domain-containing protein [Oscillibacter sp.]|jgi:hypothetical protein|nr:DUF6291 domain-containing protein [Oscillibacter sp.]
METEKKGFVLYFDMVDQIEAFPQQEQLALYRALVRYARRIAGGEEDGIEWVLRQVPELSIPAQTAFRFLAAAVLRDTNKWRARRAAFQRPEGERNSRRADSSRIPSAAAQDDRMRGVGDMARYARELRAECHASGENR